ncbi:MAG TPA: prepilin-type N-terminal cleavage/methylation domain-containing protein [Candidatus Sulfotelmatobacter sp.]|nr:prepilin-type N-terminal cleavage/methylation domain-containing protein [Candidatus Sulfotelmatobacter sp.]
MKSFHSKKNSRRRAFTLIEIMVALAIFLMVIGVIYATWALVMRATQVGQSAAAQAQRQRVALNTIEDALMCCQSFQASQQYYSFICAGGDAPVLSFASRLPAGFPRNTKFEGHDLRRITFSLEADNENFGGKDLVLRQNPVLMDMDEGEQKTPLVLLRNVKLFDVECYDTNQNEWVTDWDNTNAIPPVIRIGIAFGANENAGNSGDTVSVVRSYTMPAAMMPAAVQMGGQGGFGNNPNGGQLRVPGH